MAHPAHPQSEALVVTDPVCGMGVERARTPHHYAHEGREYFFCCARCRSKFIADPEKYRHGAPAEAAKPPVRRRDLHLPDAPANPPSQPGRLPDLRHGARTRGGR